MRRILGSQKKETEKGKKPTKVVKAIEVQGIDEVNAALIEELKKFDEASLDELRKLQPGGDPSIDVQRCADLFKCTTVVMFVSSLLAAIKSVAREKGDEYRSYKNFIMVSAYFLDSNHQTNVIEHMRKYDGKTDDEIPQGDALNNYLGFFGTARWMADTVALTQYFAKLRTNKGLLKDAST